MKRPMISKSGHAGLAMTSMIDVVFLLLVFLFGPAAFDEPEQDLPSSFAIATEPGAARSETPTEEVPSQTPVEELILQIQKDNGMLSYRLGTTSLVSLSALRDRLNQIADLGISPRVIIDPADDIPMADTVDTLDAVRMAGFGRVHLAVSAAAESANDSGQPFKAIAP